MASESVGHFCMAWGSCAYCAFCGKEMPIATHPQSPASPLPEAAAPTPPVDAVLGEPVAAILLAEQVMHMEMVTERGKRARELARRVLAGHDETLRYLRLIVHATAPSPDDGGHHEAAHDLASQAIEALAAPVASRAVQAEPMAWADDEGRVLSAAQMENARNHQGGPGKIVAAKYSTPLFPPAQPVLAPVVREPLTQEYIDFLHGEWRGPIVNFVRAIERAHGIQATTGEQSHSIAASPAGAEGAGS